MLITFYSDITVIIAELESHHQSVMEHSHVPSTMRAVVLNTYDDSSEALTIEEHPVPQPGKGQVLVHMAASPINPSDLMFLRGLYGVRKELPVVPGFEGSGTVVATGDWTTSRALLGRNVACLALDDTNGTWAEYMVTSINRCIPLLGINDLQGAMLVVNPGTAWGLIDIARREKHRAVVQTAAAGALGQMIVRLSQRYQLPMIHIVRRQEQVALLRGLGAIHILDSSASDFDEQLRARCRELGTTLAFDAVAGEMTGRVLQAMPKGARITVYGGLSEQPCQIHPLDPIFKGKTVDGFWLSSWLEKQTLPDILRLARGIQQLINTDLKSTVRACFPLEEARQALDLYAQRMTEGKVLLMPALRRK
ncbi:MAG: zinc-binding dehydrogenase [Chloroflexi bacterium AL-W]|nr:zinc-binding dehydrogenase [Chloroflexi bacterium AL-N1]NOK70483.1 zinc-binding dehydrogenase [Chloroflexi bacterium AL-N10]NOK78158.1 zinc-binding dehydrogenase [Chloroflexi bacterium AL-N5]NOK85257.1 zinc-binding dehydrogenase [Chloroflexi bacterium AL-W]NOK92022.1 zinc-binding dehydrogenase [Chloroflexi bacterium AL-N15]